MGLFEVAGYRQDQGKGMFGNRIFPISRDIGNRYPLGTGILYVYMVKAG
jgi:hypothetical protein